MMVLLSAFISLQAVGQVKVGGFLPKKDRTQKEFIAEFKNNTRCDNMILSYMEIVNSNSQMSSLGRKLKMEHFEFLVQNSKVVMGSFLIDSLGIDSFENHYTVGDEVRSLGKQPVDRNTKYALYSCDDWDVYDILWCKWACGNSALAFYPKPKPKIIVKKPEQKREYRSFVPDTLKEFLASGGNIINSFNTTNTTTECCGNQKQSQTQSQGYYQQNPQPQPVFYYQQGYQQPVYQPQPVAWYMGVQVQWNPQRRQYYAPQCGWVQPHSVNRRPVGAYTNPSNNQGPVGAYTNTRANGNPAGAYTNQGPAGANTNVRRR